MFTKFTATLATRHAGPPRSMGLLLVGTLLMAAWGSRAHAGDVYIVCSAGVTLSMTDIRDVFLGEKQFSNAIRLVPVDNLAAQPAFLEKVLKMDAVKYATTWVKKSFRDGVNSPAALANDAVVLEFIRRTPGGCGYFGAEPLSGGVTVIGKY